MNASKNDYSLHSELTLMAVYFCPHCKKYFKTHNHHICMRDPKNKSCGSCSHICIDNGERGDYNACEVLGDAIYKLTNTVINGKLKVIGCQHWSARTNYRGL